MQLQKNPSFFLDGQQFHWPIMLPYISSNYYLAWHQRQEPVPGDGCSLFVHGGAGWPDQVWLNVEWFCYCRTWWLLPSTTVKRGGVVGCQLEDGSFLCCWWWGVARCELKGRAWIETDKRKCHGRTMIKL
jgi:hypothetical protein